MRLFTDSYLIQEVHPVQEVEPSGQAREYHTRDEAESKAFSGRPSEGAERPFSSSSSLGQAAMACRKVGVEEQEERKGVDDRVDSQVDGKSIPAENG